MQLPSQAMNSQHFRRAICVQAKSYYHPANVCIALVSNVSKNDILQPIILARRNSEDT